MDHENRKILQQGAKTFGLNLGDQELDLFSRYLEVLEQGCARMNLTAIREERDRVVLLLLDSLAVAGYVAERFPGREGIRFMDLGSGAGVPGIPVKIALPWIRMTLCDSRHKKAAFLEEAVRELGLNGVEIFAGRAEDFQIKSEIAFQGGFEVVTAKAVGDLGYLARTCRNLIVPGGVLVAMKGPDPAEEIRREEKKLKKAGFSVAEVRSYDLADQGKRTLVVLSRSTG